MKRLINLQVCCKIFNIRGCNICYLNVTKMGKLIVLTSDMPKNVLISSREFCRHIPSYSTTQAASNKGCLHSLCWGVSLKQRVTCVTISNKGDVV